MMRKHLVLGVAAVEDGRMFALLRGRELHQEESELLTALVLSASLMFENRANEFDREGWCWVNERGRSLCLAGVLRL